MYEDATILIRAATEADLPAIVAIYNSIIPGRMVTADLTPVTVADRRPWLQAHDPARRPVWVAEEPAGVVAWLSFDTFYPRAAYDGRRGFAVGEAFAQYDEIGFHFVTLIREHVAGTSVAGLHFVEDVRDIVRAAPVLQKFVIPLRRVP